jgi:hypothetical protein
MDLAFLRTGSILPRAGRQWMNHGSWIASFLLVSTVIGRSQEQTEEKKEEDAGRG